MTSILVVEEHKTVQLSRHETTKTADGSHAITWYLQKSQVMLRQLLLWTEEEVRPLFGACICDHNNNRLMQHYHEVRPEGVFEWSQWCLQQGAMMHCAMFGAEGLRSKNEEYQAASDQQ
ncbi:unnamed protein product, partial [Amoebophrya sp. A25]|eukprot:GSA25T00027001001.1